MSWFAKCFSVRPWGFASALIVVAIAGCRGGSDAPSGAREGASAEARVDEGEARPASETRTPSNSAKQEDGGWQASASPKDEGASKETTPPESPSLSKAEQGRYDAVARKLVAAINDRDKEGYRALHTDEAWANAIDWWREMFSRQVLSFGPIRRAYQTQRGPVRVGKMGMGGDARDGASFVAIFEKKVGGLFSFELNDADKIVHTSVFIKEELGQYEGLGAKPIYQNDD